MPTAKLILGKDSYTVTFSTCQELVNEIKARAREMGWAKIKVFVDGDPVSPAEFCSRLHDNVVITVAKYDVAGAWEFQEEESPAEAEEGVWSTEEEQPQPETAAEEAEEQPIAVFLVKVYKNRIEFAPAPQ